MARKLSKIEKEASLAADEFIKMFAKTFKVTPRVSYSFNHEVIITSLTDLGEIVDDLIKVDPNITVEGACVRHKNRKRELIIYRQCTFAIACKMGYGCSAIAKHFGFTHATVIYAEAIIDNLIQTKEFKVISTYNLIEDELKKRFGSDRHVQHDD